MIPLRRAGDQWPIVRLGSCRFFGVLHLAAQENVASEFWQLLCSCVINVSHSRAISMKLGATSY